MSAETLTTPAEITRQYVLASFENFIRFFQVEHYGYKPDLYDYQLRITDAMEDVIRSKTRRLIINIPPRYRKTTIGVILFIAYGMAISGGKAKFIHVSYSKKLALDNSEAAKDIIMSDAFQQLFPEIQIKKDSKGKEKWYTTEGGGVYATSSGGQVTGFGAGFSPEEYEDDDEELENELDEFFQGFESDQFGGALLIDDANKAEDGDFPAALAKVNQRADTTIFNRVNSRYTPIVNIQQRVAKNDLSGKLIKDGGWTLLKLAAEDPDTGEVLCEKIHTKTELQEIKERNEEVYQSQYLQEPREAKGLMYGKLNKTALTLETVLQNPDLIFTSTDANMTDGNDYFVTWFWALYQGRPFIFDAIYMPVAAVNVKPLFIQQHLLYKAQVAVIEQNNQQTFIGEVQTKLPCSIVATTAVGNKLARIVGKSYLAKHVAFIWNDNPDYHKAIAHMEAFNRNGKSEDNHDDAEDAFTLGLDYLWNNYQSIFITA